MKDKDSIVSKFSSFFIKKTRVTFLLFIAVLAFGFVAYTQWLPREGFPKINIPFVLVKSTYLVGDVNKVNTEITEPIENALQNIDEIKTISSDTGPMYSILQVEFKEVVTSEEGVVLINNELAGLSLPKEANLSAIAIDGTKFEGEYDMMVSLVTKDDSQESQNLLSDFVSKINSSDAVISAEAIPLMSTGINPMTGQKVEMQTNFHRVAIKDGDELIFKNAYAIGIIKSDNVDAVTFSENIHEKIDSLLSQDKFETLEIHYTFDIANKVNDQIASLEDSFLIGMIAVVFVLFAFINWRASLITAIFIPTVMAATFGVLYMFGYTLNVISLFSLILVLGLFVDDAIVAVEFIDYKKKLGFKGIDAIKSAINDIGSADISGTITTMLVFAPMLFTTGILGKFISAIPITVIIALLISLVFALSIVPFFSNFIILDVKKNKKGEKNKISFFDKFSNIIGKFVNWYLVSPLKTWGVIFVSILLIGMGGYFAKLIPFSIFPEPKDTNDLAVTISFTQEVQLNEAMSITKDVEQVLNEEISDEIKMISYSTYVQDLGKYIQLSIKLTDYKNRDITSTEIIDIVNDKFEVYDNASIKIGQVNAGPPAEEYPFAMQIYGDDSKASVAAANEFKSWLTDRTYEDLGSITEVKIDKIYGISKIDGERYIVVKAKLDDAKNTALITTIRDDMKEEFNIDKLKTMGLSEDSIEFDFGFESMNMESFNSLMIGFIITLVVMYVVLVLQYNSYLQPLLVFMAIPLSFPLLFPGLYITNNALSFFSMLGIMGLVGIVVNNTIMLVNFINQSKDEGTDINTAIANSVKVRLRPILTTSTTTLVGLIPLALTDPFWEGLAYTIIFGLISSSTLVILVFPAYVKVIESFRTWLHGKFKIN